MRKKILAVSLALAMVLSSPAYAQEPSSQEIVDRVIESFDNIRTYQFDLTMTMNATGESVGEVTEHSVIMDNIGTLDFENEQMSANLSVSSSDEMIMAVQMYITNGMLYAKPEVAGEESGWIKEEVPAKRWEIMKGVSGIDNYKELLKTAQVEVIGSEEVKDVDCYVLEITPEMTQLYQTVMEPAGGAVMGGMLPPIPEDFLDEIIKRFSVKQWIAKDTYFLMKAEIDMTIESTPELMDYMGEEGEKAIDIALSFLAYNYNQPVSIVVPPEAMEATE